MWTSTFIAVIKFLYKTAKNYKWIIILIIILDVAEVGLSLLFVWLSKNTIDVATGTMDGNLTNYAIKLVIIVLAQILLQIVSIRISNISWTKMSNSLRYKMYDSLVYAQWNELKFIHSGDMLNRIMRDSEDIIKILISGVPAAISATIQLIGAVIMLFSFDSTLAIILGIGVPFLAVFSKIYYNKMRLYSQQIKESESKITSTLEEGLMNQLVIRSFELQPYTLNNLKSEQSILLKKVRKRTRINVFANIFMRLSFQGGYITAFLWGIKGLYSHTITVGMLTAFLQLVARIQRPVFDLMSQLPNIVAARTSADRLQTILSIKKENISERIFFNEPVELKVEDITFSYENNSRKILENFSMTAKQGDLIAVIGESGAGKTTLLRLLLSLEKPNSGNIRLKSKNYSTEISEKTRSNFVYVPQGASLFSGTIRDNLMIGKENATDNELKHVLEIASAQFVYNLPNGLDTYIGEKSSGISEGQAQRIAIARSLLRPGKILLLDEATSALDSKTEKEFLNNLNKNLGDRIVIFVSHHEEVKDFCKKYVYI